jgi:hypothetical protein
MPECYREQIGRTFLKMLKKHKDTKKAMYLTRLEYKGRDGKMIGRSTVYRHVELVRGIDGKKRK